MAQRSLNQNRLYHELCHILYRQKRIVVYDGRFGLRNPVIFSPVVFTYDEFRVWMAELDLEYPRDTEGKPLSSTKLSIDEFNSHINYLTVLCAEFGE